MPTRPSRFTDPAEKPELVLGCEWVWNPHFGWALIPKRPEVSLPPRFGSLKRRRRKAKKGTRKPTTSDLLLNL